jgi:hypothetical protein
LHIALDAPDRPKPMLDAVLDARRLAGRHTGLASATTLLRNLIDKSSGVFTSTLVWVRLSIAAAIAAMSKSVIPSGIDQQIKIALVRILAAQGRTEDARVQFPVRGDDPADFLAAPSRARDGFMTPSIARLR